LSVLILVVVAGGLLVVRPGPVDGWLTAGEEAAPSSAPPPTPDPSPSAVLAAVTTDGVAPDAQKVTAAIGSLVRASALGSSVHVSVIDGPSGDVLFERESSVASTPASTTKLLTAAAVLASRGAAYRIETRAVAGAKPGEVVLIGGGDPTLAVDGDGLFPGGARLDKLAAQVKKALGGQKPTKVVVDASLYGGPETAAGWSSGLIGEGQVSRIRALTVDGGRVKPVHNESGGDLRASDPAVFAGGKFAKLLGLDKSAVSEGRAPEAPTAPSASAPASAPAAAPVAGEELGKVESAPMVHIVDWMLDQSDNVLAEGMARQVALANGQEASFTGGAAATLAELEKLGLDTAGAKLSDGSGLSRNNKIAPVLLTDILALAAGGEQPQISSIFGGLPVAGWSGTMATRMAAPKVAAARGIVRAKTGSLSGVTNMSGQVVTKDGRLLFYAFMADKAGNSVQARAAWDAVAAKLQACGCQ
jgi:serine-type D-Ala-D-Ala carboxypeptidase/endopeptidase (penicillin-binding protein 4)